MVPPGSAPALTVRCLPRRGVLFLPTSESAIDHLSNLSHCNAVGLSCCCSVVALDRRRHVEAMHIMAGDVEAATHCRGAPRARAVPIWGAILACHASELRQSLVRTHFIDDS